MGDYMQTCFKFILISMLVVVIGGCCTEKEKREAGDRIDRAIQKMIDVCKLVQNQDTRDQCYMTVVPLIAELEMKYLEYLQACENGDDDLAKQILRDINNLLSNRFMAGAVITPAGQIVNKQNILFPEDLLLCNITAVKEVETRMLNLVAEDGVHYLPQAVGQLSIDRTSVTQDEDTLQLQILRGSVETNHFSVTGTVSLLIDGSTINGTVTGEMWFVSVFGTGNTPRFLPTKVSLTFTSAQLSFTLKLDKSCPYNELVLDSAGNGTIGFNSNVVYPLNQEIPPFAPSAFWLTIPVTANSELTTFQLTTGGDWLPSTDLLPVAPYPVADFNKDGLVDQTDMTAYLSAYGNLHYTADVNADGIVDQTDFDYFNIYWSHEMGL